MTLKEFVKAWKECESYDKFKDEFFEKYGIHKAEFDEIKFAAQQDYEWHDELLDYFLYRLGKNDSVAEQINTQFNYNKLDLNGQKRLLENDEFMINLEMLWLSQFDF